MKRKKGRRRAGIVLAAVLIAAGASRVATSGMRSAIKYFAGLFRLDKSDPLLPDLSAVIVILPPETKGVAN